MHLKGFLNLTYLKALKETQHNTTEQLAKVLSQLDKQSVISVMQSTWEAIERN